MNRMPSATSRISRFLAEGLPKQPPAPAGPVAPKAPEAAATPASPSPSPPSPHALTPLTRWLHTSKTAARLDTALKWVPLGAWIFAQHQMSFRLSGPEGKFAGARLVAQGLESANPALATVSDYLLRDGVTLATLKAPIIPDAGDVALVSALAVLATTGVNGYLPFVKVPKKLSDFDGTWLEKAPDAIKHLWAGVLGGAIGYGNLRTSTSTPLPHLARLKEKSANYPDAVRERYADSWDYSPLRLAHLAAARVAAFFGSVIPETKEKRDAWLAESLNYLSFLYSVGYFINHKTDPWEYVTLTASTGVLSVFGGKNASIFTRAFGPLLGLGIIARQTTLIVQNSVVSMVAGNEFNPAASLGIQIAVQILLMAGLMKLFEAPHEPPKPPLAPKKRTVPHFHPQLVPTR